MSPAEAKPLLDTGTYVGLDGLIYPSLAETCFFASSDSEQPSAEIDIDFKKTVNIAHYLNHAGWWFQQTPGSPYSESTIRASVRHYEDLAELMEQADPADAESFKWIETEYRRIDAENQDTAGL